VTATFNSSGLLCVSGRVKVLDSTIANGNGYGVVGDERVLLRGSTVSGFGLSGVHAFRAGLNSSTVAGNGSDGDCNVTRVCADLFTFAKPRLRTSSCDTSSVASSNENPSANPDWDVCSLD